MPEFDSIQLTTTCSRNFDNLSVTSLNILYLNIRSCRNKLDCLESFIHSLNQSIHVIVLSETWLYSWEIFNIHNYRSYHCTRDSDRGGGVSIFVRQDVSSQMILSTHRDVNDFVVVDLINEKIKIMGVYNPGRNQLEFLNELENVLHDYPKTIVLGDFNINMLDTQQRLVSDYTITVEGSGFLFINPISSDYATRVSNSISTLIDHAFTDISEYSYDFRMMDSEPHVSDHRTILLSVNCNLRTVRNRKTKTVISYNRITPESLALENATSFDELMNSISSQIQQNTREINVNVNKSPRKPYITNEILSMIDIKNRLYRNSRRDSRYTAEYIQYRNNLNNHIKWTKKNYYNSKLGENTHNPKQFWNTLNEIIYNNSNQQSHSYAIDCPTGRVTDERQLCEMFNEYFINSVETIITHRPPSVFVQTDVVGQSFNFSTVTENDVLRAFDNINVNASTGNDGVPNKFLKNFKHMLVPKYTEMFNHCIIANQFPSSLKTAKVIPLYKAGSKSDICNYRPISVLNSASKPFERLLHDQIRVFLDQHNVINQNQFGFIPKSNTLTASINFVCKIIDGLDRSEKVAAMFIDFKKAFDCVDHKILLHKLTKIGFSPEAQNLMESYLTNRCQVVKINNSVGQPRYIKYGVPQGSILGPLLFIIFINDIFALPLKGYLQLYADDATLYYEAGNEAILVSNMEHDIKLINQWCKQNCLALNVDKTLVMTFSLRGQSPIIRVVCDNTYLKQVEQTKFLGLIIDSNIKWTSHIINVENKLKTMTFALKKLRPLVTEDTAWKVYFAFVHPHIMYMNCIWGSTSNVHLLKLSRLQNGIIKIIKKLPRLTRSSDLYNEKVLALNNLNKFEIMIYLYKVQHGLIKCNIPLIRVSTVHTQRTRQQNNIYQVLSRTSMAQNSVFQRGIRLFNNLPIEIKLARSLSSFKNRLRSHLSQLAHNQQ